MDPKIDDKCSTQKQGRGIPVNVTIGCCFCYKLKVCRNNHSENKGLNNLMCAKTSTNGRHEKINGPRKLIFDAQNLTKWATKAYFWCPKPHNWATKSYFRRPKSAVAAINFEVLFTALCGAFLFSWPKLWASTLGRGTHDEKVVVAPVIRRRIWGLRHRFSPRPKPFILVVFVSSNPLVPFPFLTQGQSMCLTSFITTRLHLYMGWINKSLPCKIFSSKQDDKPKKPNHHLHPKGG